MIDERNRQDYILGARERMIMLPASIRFDCANFEQSRDDLIISDRSGDRVFIRGFFLQSEFPILACDDGELMSGELAATLIRLSPCAQAALLEIDKIQTDLADTAS